MPRPVVGHSVNPFLFGTGSWVYGQLQGLRRWSAVVVCKRRENRDVFPFENVHAREDLSFPRQLRERVARKFRGYFPFQRQAFQESDARLIHSHFGSQGWTDRPLAKALGLPLVTSFYGADIWKLSQRAEWRERYTQLFAEGSLFLVEGNAMREKVTGMGCPPEKIVVQHLGIEVGAEEFVERRPDEDGLVRLLVAGRAVEKKGLDLAVRAFARARTEVPGLRLSFMLIARYPGEKARVERLHELVAELGVGDGVEFPPPRPYDEYRKSLRDYHVFVTPSRHASDGDAEGGAPVSLIEMSASGTPIVASRHCDIPEVVPDGEAGILFDEGDLDGFTDALIAVGSAPERWPEYGRAGRAHVEREYDLSKQVPLLEEIYDRVADSA